MTDKEKELQAEAIGYYRKRIAELEMTVGTLRTFSNEQATCIERLEKENAELKSENQKWQEEWQEQVQKANDEGYARTLQNMQLTKAKEIIKKLLHSLKNEGSDYTFALENTHPVLAEAKQFLSEVEK